MLVDTLWNILQAYVGPGWHIYDALREIESVDSRICMNMSLQRKASAALWRTLRIDA